MCSSDSDGEISCKGMMANAPCKEYTASSPLSLEDCVVLDMLIVIARSIPVYANVDPQVNKACVAGVKNNWDCYCLSKEGARHQKALFDESD